jgi:hypothetical protein
MSAPGAKGSSRPGTEPLPYEKLIPAGPSAFELFNAAPVGAISLEPTAKGLVVGGPGPAFGNYALFSEPVAVGDMSWDFSYTTAQGDANESAYWTCFGLMNRPSFMVGDPADLSSVGFAILVLQYRLDDGKSVQLFQVLKSPGLQQVASILVPGKVQGQRYTLRVRKGEDGWHISAAGEETVASFDEIPADSFDEDLGFTYVAQLCNVGKPVAVTLHRLADRRFGN